MLKPLSKTGETSMEEEIAYSVCNFQCTSRKSQTDACRPKEGPCDNH